jgi:hypothetical protein
MTRTWALWAVAVALAAALAGGGWWLSLGPARDANPGQPPDAPPLDARAEPEPGLPPGVELRFVEVTRAAGIDFRHFDGRTPMQYIMDQTGSGLAWLDYDQDGLMDLFLVQGAPFVGPAPSPAPTCKLYRNLGDGTFRDVTAEAGVGHVGCGQGVAVGDIDNDGFPDLFVTCYGKPNVLYHNVPDGKGGRKFVDVTAGAGLLDHPHWKEHANYSTSAAFLDYDGDGLLDLFVCSYVWVDRDLDRYPECRDRKHRRDACPPNAFRPTRCLLYRNNGDGTFTDVSHEAGIDEPRAKALGVVALDLDGDGLIDLFVANDGMPNFLFRNLGNGKFESIGLVSGCAVNLAGHTQAYMGVDADDLAGDGLPDLYVTAFARESSTFFRNRGHCQFLDMTHGSGLGPPSWHHLGFGACFLDLDRDGRLDIAVANGHVSANVDEDGNPDNTFRQVAQLYHNLGDGRFQEVSQLAGPYFRERHVGRGLAACDYDNDGRQDLAFSNSGGPAVLLHNESTDPHHWLRLDLQGTRSNRDAVGARVTVTAGDRKLVRHRKGGGSYCSAGDPRLFFGLGPATEAEDVEVRWPSGTVQKLGKLKGDCGYLVTEGDTKTEARPAGWRR